MATDDKPLNPLTDYTMLRGMALVVDARTQPRALAYLAGRFHAAEEEVRAAQMRLRALALLRGESYAWAVCDQLCQTMETADEVSAQWCCEKLGRLAADLERALQEEACASTSTST